MFNINDIVWDRSEAKFGMISWGEYNISQVKYEDGTWSYTSNNHLQLVNHCDTHRVKIEIYGNQVSEHV